MVAFVAGTTLSAANLNSAFNALTINAQTGTTYTLALSDAGGMVTLSNASTITLTVPANGTVAFPTGSVVSLLVVSAGAVSIVGAGGVTINGASTTVSQYESVTLMKTATNTWSILRGGLPKASVSGYTGTPTIDTVSRAGKTIYTFTSSGSLTFSAAGSAEVFLISGGGAGNGANYWGGAGAIAYGTFTFTAATHTVTVGSGGVTGGTTAARNGTVSSIGTTVVTGRSSFNDTASIGGLSGAGATDADNTLDFSTSITGSAVTYGLAGQASPRANRGDGNQNGAGSAGIVIVVIG